MVSTPIALKTKTCHPICRCYPRIRAGPHPHRRACLRHRGGAKLPTAMPHAYLSNTVVIRPACFISCQRSDVYNVGYQFVIHHRASKIRIVREYQQYNPQFDCCVLFISLAKTLPRCYPSINVGSGVGKCWLWHQRRRSVLPASKSAATSSKPRQKHD